MICVYCKQEYSDTPNIARLHQHGGAGFSPDSSAFLPDCMVYPCTCLPHQGPFHVEGCPRRAYWDRDLNRSLGFQHDAKVKS